MEDAGNPDVWNMLVQQTPVAFRWLIVALSGAVFWLAYLVISFGKSNSKEDREEISYIRDRVHALESISGEVTQVLRKVEIVEREQKELYKLIISMHHRGGPNGGNGGLSSGEFQDEPAHTFDTN